MSAPHLRCALFASFARPARAGRRTRTALLLAAIALAACDEKKPSPPEPSAPAPAASTLPIDASVLGEPSDPPAPAGDLRAELDRFVNVDTCVAERAKVDPLIGDALSAIGYETFFRDACRLLEAAKDKKPETCTKIDASALKARCVTWVAMVSLAPDACPLEFEGLPARGRGASCVAIASRDVRLCAGEPRVGPRVTCEAMVLRDPAKCDALLPGARATCQREVARWRSVLSAPLEGLEPIPPARGKLALHAVAGTAAPIATDADLGGDVGRGLIMITSGSRTRIELGSFVESETARMAALPQKRLRLGLAVTMDDKRTTLQKLELEIPGDAPIVSPPGTCDCAVTMTKAPKKRGDAVAFALEGTLSSAGRSYKISAEIASFVRDVVVEAPGSRLLPSAPSAGVKPR